MLVHRQSASALADAEPLDAADALARLGGHTALLEELAGMFLEDCPRQLTEITECLRRQDAPALYFAAHQMRGAVACFRAPSADETAEELEASARDGDLPAAARACAALEAALHRLTPALTALSLGAADLTAGGNGP